MQTFNALRVQYDADTSSIIGYLSIMLCDPKLRAPCLLIQRLLSLATTPLSLSPPEQAA